MAKKKGQLMSEPFMWILALLVVALVLVFGFSAIKKLTNTFDKTSIANYVTEFKKLVEEVYYMDTGSMKAFKIRLPDKITKVCFYGGSGDASQAGIDPTEMRIIQLNGNKNMFFLPLDAYESTMMMHKVEKLNVVGIKCFRNNEDIRLVAQGDYVDVEMAVLITNPR